MIARGVTGVARHPGLCVNGKRTCTNAGVVGSRTEPRQLARKALTAVIQDA